MFGLKRKIIIHTTFNAKFTAINYVIQVNHYKSSGMNVDIGIYHVEFTGYKSTSIHKNQYRDEG